MDETSDRLALRAYADDSVIPASRARPSRQGQPLTGEIKPVLHRPRRAIISRQPLGAAGAAGELHFLRLPLDFLAVKINLVEQMAADRGASSDNFTRDRLFA